MQYTPNDKQRTAPGLLGTLPGPRDTLWGVSSTYSGLNVLTNGISNGPSYLTEIKDSVISGLEWVSQAGPLTGEEVTGLEITLNSVTLHADAIHRGGGQVIPTFRNCCTEAMLAAGPVLLEPHWQFEVHCNEQLFPAVLGLFTARRGGVAALSPSFCTGCIAVQCVAPVSESLYVTAAIQAISNDAIIAHREVYRWGVVPGAATDLHSLCGQVVTELRLKNGLPPLV